MPTTRVVRVVYHLDNCQDDIPEAPNNATQWSQAEYTI